MDSTSLFACYKLVEFDIFLRQVALICGSLSSGTLTREIAYIIKLDGFHACFWFWVHYPFGNILNISSSVSFAGTGTSCTILDTTRWVLDFDSFKISTLIHSWGQGKNNGYRKTYQFRETQVYVSTWLMSIKG